MLHVPSAAVLSASERLYRLLLFIYPRAYRREYGPLMIQAYRDLCRHSYRQKGMVGIASLWSRLLADLVTSSIEQHLDALREGDRIMMKKEHTRVIKYARLLCTVLIASTPFALSGVFVLRNGFPDPDPFLNTPLHPGRELFLDSSFPPAIFSLAISLLLQVALGYALQAHWSSFSKSLVRISTGLALIPVLWAVVFVTEFNLRVRFFALWDVYVSDILRVSTSSIVFGACATLLVLFITLYPDIKGHSTA